MTRMFIFLRLTFLANCLLIPLAFSGEIIREVMIPKLKVLDFSRQGQILTATDYYQTIDQGEITLPFRDIKIMIPYGMKVTQVHVERSGDYLIQDFISPIVGKGMRPYSLAVDPQGKNQRDFNIKSKIEKKKTYGEVGTHRIHLFNVLAINLYPVYQDGAGNFFQPEKMTIRVQLEKESSSPQLSWPRFRNDHIDQVMKMVINPEVVSTYPIQKSESDHRSKKIHYLVVTTNSLKNIKARNNISSFLKVLKEKKNLSSKIVTIEEIKGRFKSGDIQEKIREAIKEEYQNYGVEYLLLVGDESKIPSRKLYSEIRGYNGSWQEIKAHIPADFYYGCLDGNFNNNNNLKFGEPDDGINGGDVDFLCEVTVGRWPVDNQSELSNVVQKTLSFYQGEGSLGRSKKLLLLGEKLFAELGLWGGTYMDQLIGESSDHNFITKGFGEDWQIDKLYEKVKNWSANDVRYGVEKNNYLILNHLGHSNDGYNMKISNWFYTPFQNKNPFFLYTQGCFAANFVKNDSIVEMFMLESQGAVGAIANSHYGLGPEDPDPATTVTPGASQILNRYFVHYLINGEYGEGKGVGFYHQKSKEEMIRYMSHQEARWVSWVANYLGDPALNLWK